MSYTEPVHIFIIPSSQNTLTYATGSSRNLGLYTTAGQWHFGRYYLQSYSTCHVTVNLRNAIARKWQPKPTDSTWFRWLWGTAIHPRPWGRLSKCQLLMCCALRICIVKLQLVMARNSIYFFPYFSFVRVFFIVGFFYGCIWFSHGTNVSFSIFHWQWQKE